MDLQEILSEVITRTNDIFRAEAGSVALLESNGQEIVIRAAVGAGANEVRGMRVPVTKGVVGWVATHEKPALIPDVNQDPRFFQDIDKESGFQTRSILCVPMRAEGRVIGVIELMNMRSDYLTQDGVQILSVIADHAALIIENVRLLAQTRRQAEEQALLFEAMAIVTSDLALETVLDAVSRQIVEALRADLGIISRWDRPSNQLIAMQVYVGHGMTLQRPETRTLSLDSFLHSILETQKSKIIDGTQSTLTPAERSWLDQLEVEALLLMPLIYRRNTVGLVEIGRRYNESPITPRELRLGETMASQATTAIEHARLYREATRRLAEAKVLQEVMVVAASTLSFEQALNSTIEALHRLLGIERLGFFLPESPGYLVAHPSFIGFNPDNGLLRVPAARSAVGWVCKTGQPLLIEDVDDAPHYFELASDTKSELCVPVRLGGQVLAVLNAESPRRDAFDQEDLRLFNAIAAELAVALENAQLFEKEHRLARQQQALLDIFADLSAELEPAALFQRIIERAIEVIPNAEAGSLIIPRGDHFGFAAVVGFDLEQLYDIPFTVGDFIHLGAPPLQPGKPLQKVDRLTREDLINFNEVHHPERYEALVKAGRLNEIQSSLRAVLVVGDKLLGSISVDSLTKIDAFSEEDEQILLLFANQAAIAIHNARLFEEIRAAEANYRDLFDNANDLIFTLDSTFRISSANKVLLRTSGYSLEEVIGTHVTRFVSSRQTRELLKLLKEQLRSTNVPSSFELAFRSKDGQEKLLEVTMRIKRRGRRPTELHFIARDITRRRELEKQLQQIEKLSTIGKLVAGVAHELNNPLTSIVGYTNLLQESDLTSMQQKDLRVIARQAERARLIVRDLLTFARNITLETEPVDINEVVQNSLSLLKSQLQEYNIQVISKLNFGLPVVIADPRRMEQVFVNLITNALQELSQQPRPGQITIETDFTETAIRASIADNGPGISEHNLNRIFDPFFSTKQVGEGTGLGLSICFGIVTEHHGRIWVENQPSGGTIFFVELPLTNLESPRQQETTQSSDPLSKSPLPAIRCQILVVDDEPSLLVLLSRILEQRGHVVETAPNGRMALEKLANQQYDLIISDILMPDMFGTELYTKVTDKYPHFASKFIFITGNATDPETHTFLEQSGLVWLTKPFLPADVETAVANALRGVATTAQS